MKQIFIIGTKQCFTYTTSMLFKKKIEEHWLIRNIKYIYANNEEEAKEKYKNWFFIEYEKLPKYPIEYYCPANTKICDMNEKRINITETKIVKFFNEFLNINIENLKRNMQAEDFKEWWFDNGRCNQLPN